MSESPSPRFDPASADGIVRANLRESRRLRRLKHRPPNTLPARPSLEHYREQARDLHKSQRAQNPTAKRHSAQFEVARGVGYASWPKLAAAIHERERVAKELSEALSRNDHQAIVRVVREHPLALLDAGAVASPEELGLLIELGPVSRHDSALRTALLDAVAEHHKPEGLDECVRKLLDWSDADPLYANDVIQQRRDGAEGSPTGAHDAEMFDNVLGYLAWHVDEPDSEYMSEDD